MPDDEITKPGTDLLIEGANTVASDRARRISSLHRTTDELVQEQNRKRLQIANEVDAITKQQQKAAAQLKAEYGDMTTETAKGYSNVLKGLGRTIDSLATGVKSITIDTSKATSEAIGQYGKAISEDISINKTNTIAMALSRATPLFGYFAAKFMETDVFTGAARKIKDKVGSAMTEGLSKAGSGIADIFRKGKNVVKEEREKEPATVSDLEQLQRTIEGTAPKLQEGGYIRRGGMVEVHPAEVVTPIDKLLEQIDQAKSADISKKLDKTLSLMSQNLVRLETVVVERKESEKGIIKTFIDEFQRARDTRQESHQKRLLKAILELKVGLIGMTSRMRIAWQRTLLQHPTFRNMLLFSDIMRSAIVSPIKFLFGVRGGYAGDVRGATATHNVFLKLSNLMALTYTTLMPKIDELVIYTKAAAEALVGEEITPEKRVTYTMFDKIREYMTSRPIQSLQESLFSTMIERLGLKKEALAEAGITGFGGFAKPGKIIEKMGVTKENILGRLFESKGFAKMKDEISKLREMKEAQEKREGPHSPSMAENISKTAEYSERGVVQAEEKATMFQSLREKANKFAEEHLGATKKVGSRLKKMGSKIWDWALIAFGFIKTVFGGGIRKLIALLTPIAGFLAGTIGRTLGGAGKLIGGAGRGIAGAAGAARAAGFMGSARAVAGFGGKVLGAGAAGIVGAGMGLADMVRAIMSGDAEGFIGNWLVRGMSGFLGRTTTGLAGAKRGALKGGALGAAAGSFIPGIGTLIGGAIGAAAGGMLGFVGGKKMSVGISKTIDVIKDYVKGAWNIVMFPFKMMKEGLKSAWILTKWGFKMTLGKAYDAFVEWWKKPGILQSVMGFITNTFSTIFDYIKKPFIWLREKIKTVLGDEMWDKISKVVKVVIYNLMFPLITIQKAFTFLKNNFVEKMSGLPIIGKIFTGIMTTVKDIHEGNLASKLEKSLQDLDENPKVVAGGYAPEGPGITAREAARITMEAEARRRGYTTLGEQVGKRVDKGAAQTTAAIINNTNMISTTNNQQSNSYGRPAGRGGGEFGSGGNFAYDVTMCNIG